MESDQVHLLLLAENRTKYNRKKLNVINIAENVFTTRTFNLTLIYLRGALVKL